MEIKVSHLASVVKKNNKKTSTGWSNVLEELVTSVRPSNSDIP